MYCARPVSRSPGAIRIISTAAPRRNASYFQGLPLANLSNPFFGRIASHDPFRGIERLLEDFTSPSFPFAPQQTARQQFQPRFDVREQDGTYELRGEIPGVESKDLEVEFADPQTLIVRGRTERESTQGAQPEAMQNEKGKEHITEASNDAVAADTAAADDKSDAGSTYSTGSYQKPSVEEDTDAAETATEAKDTPTTTPGTDQQVAAQAQAEEPQQPAQQQQQQQGHYWVSERSTGSFQRVFKFPHRVDQAAVTASLKNGILNIVVPKAAKPEPRRIQVE